MKRRDFIRFSGIGVLGCSVTKVQVAPAKGEDPKVFHVTPPQTEGPFFPLEKRLDTDADLTKITEEQAFGEAVVIQVVVKDEQNIPIPEAVVYIWQACASGRYAHAEDTNPAQLDPNFQYSAQLKTDGSGKVKIKTIVPGIYPASPTWMRPAHIHFRVETPRHGSLTTQMYFKGDKHIPKDHILRETKSLYGAEASSQLIVDFDLQRSTEGLRMGVFQIVMT